MKTATDYRNDKSAAFRKRSAKLERVLPALPASCFVIVPTDANGGITTDNELGRPKLAAGESKQRFRGTGRIPVDILVARLAEREAADRPLIDDEDCIGRLPPARQRIPAIRILRGVDESGRYNSVSGDSDVGDNVG